MKHEASALWLFSHLWLKSAASQPGHTFQSSRDPQSPPSAFRKSLGVEKGTVRLFGVEFKVEHTVTLSCESAGTWSEKQQQGDY